MQIKALEPHEIIVTGGRALHDWRVSQAVRVPGYEHSPQYQRGVWDGYYHLGKHCVDVGGGVYEFVCKRGLLSRVQQQFNLPFTDPYATPLAALSVPDRLRDNQLDALNAIAVHRWCRIAFATNAGKGAIIALAARSALQAGMQVLILSDEVEPFKALRDELSQWLDLPVGIVAAGTKQPPPEMITLAMVPTLARRLSSDKRSERLRWKDWVAYSGMLLLDEADKATASTWKKVLREAKNTRYRVGFSGTFPAPNSVGDLTLEEHIGPIVLRVRNIELIEQGVSARPLVRLHRFHAVMPGVPVGWREFTGAEKRRWVYLRAVINNHQRHALVHSLLVPGAANVVIVNQIEHGNQLANFIPGAVFLSGSATKQRRDEVLAAFNAGDIETLIVTKILDRGSNQLGNAVALHFVSGEGSTRQTLQRIGRGLRRGGGKQSLILNDIVDTGHDYLMDAARARVRLYNAEGFDVEIPRAQ